MKFLLCIFFTFCLTLSNSQTSAHNKLRKYKFILECPMYKCDIDGKIVDTTKYISQIGSKFLLIYSFKDVCIIRFILHSKKNQKNFDVFRDKEIESYKYYRIDMSQLDYKAITADFKNYSTNVGNVLTPIKLRLYPFDFSKDFTIGPSFGVKYIKNEYSNFGFNFLLSLGISSITLNEFNTSQIDFKSTEAIAFTPSLGFMFEFNRSQFGLFTGFDILSSSNPNSNKFIYENKPWISIGFGHSLFTNK